MDTEEEADMSTTELNIVEAENERVEQWRADELERAGYEPATAAMLAVRTDIDLHRATSLIQHGCPPELALRILL